MNCGRPPGFAGGSGDSFLVELDRNRARRFALRIVIKDARDNPGLPLVDFALAPYRFAILADGADHIVAIGVAAAGFSGFDTPSGQRLARFSARLIG